MSNDKIDVIKNEDGMRVADLTVVSSDSLFGAIAAFMLQNGSLVLNFRDLNQMEGRKVRVTEMDGNLCIVLQDDVAVEPAVA